MRGRILAGGTIAESDYRALVTRRIEVAKAFDATMEGGVLLMPATDHGAEPLDPQDVNHVGLGKLLRAGNFPGAAAISLPAGFDENDMPVGVQLMAPADADKRLLDYAAAIAPVIGEERMPDLSGWQL